MQYANHHDNQRSINQSINQLKRQKKTIQSKGKYIVFKT